MLLYVLEALDLDRYFTTMKDTCAQNKVVSLIAALSGIGASVLLVKKLRGKRKRVCGVDYPENTVILQVGQMQANYVPHLGHFSIKLQTYLNITKIPYQVCYDDIRGPKNKVPWIEYNGMTMGDSQLIINFLNKEFNVDLNKSLTKEKRAEAWAIQKWLEEFTYWLNVYTRWYILFYDQLATGIIADIPTPVAKLMNLFKGKRKKRMEIIGVGRHTDEEVFEMMKFDLRQLSILLGDKTYLMGGDSPTELDCTAFGQLAQIRWATPDACPGKQLLTGELTNLMDYTDRIKEKFWPDWNKLISKPPSAEAH